MLRILFIAHNCLRFHKFSAAGLPLYMMAPTGSFYARYSSGSYKLAPTGKDNSTKVPPSRNEDSKPEPKESMRTESPPPPKTEDKTIDFTKPILDHGHSSSYWPGESEDPHQNRDWDADSKYLYSDYFLAMEASSNDLKLVEKMENLTVLGQNGESSGTCTRRKSEGKKRIVPILSMPENDLFGYSAADSDSDDGKESGQFDQARKDDNRPIGIRRMHPPPDAVRVTPQERLFHVDHLRVIWGVELPNSDRPTAPGVWHPNDGLHGTMPSIIITHSKGEPWVPSHPRERPSHGAVLDIYRDDKRWTTYSDDALPLFVEKARQKYEYTGHYRVVIRPEETLSRLAMIAQIEPHVQEFFAWKVWGHRYFREDFFKAVRESIVDRELVLAHARDPRTTLKWTDLMSSVREQKVKDAFFKVEATIPI